MSSRKKIDPAYYENRSFADEFSEAIADETLIKAVPGKSIIEVAREQVLREQVLEVGVGRAATKSQAN